jgi:ABC-type molybdate transport system substrate-binding protein
LPSLDCSDRIRQSATLTPDSRCMSLSLMSSSVFAPTMSKLEATIGLGRRAICRWLLVLAPAWLCSAGCHSAHQPAAVPSDQPVRLSVFAPWSMEKRLRRIFEKYQQRHPNVAFELHTGTPGSLMKRMNEGERPDVYVSMGPVGVEVLRKMGIVRPGTETQILRQRMILVCSEEMKQVVKDIHDLAKPEVGAVGLGRATLSAGVFSRQALQKAGLLEAVEPKAQISPFRAYLTGSVDAAIILEECCYDEDLLLGQVVPRHGVCVVGPLPEDLCPPLPVIAVALTGSAPADVAADFVSFLAEKGPQDILHRRGPGACPLCDAEP